MENNMNWKKIRIGFLYSIYIAFGLSLSHTGLASSIMAQIDAQRAAQEQEQNAQFEARLKAQNAQLTQNQELLDAKRAQLSQLVTTQQPTARLFGRENVQNVQLGAAQILQMQIAQLERQATQLNAQIAQLNAQKAAQEQEQNAQQAAQAFLNAPPQNDVETSK